MHKLWGRALEVRSQCRCHFCAPHGLGVTRHANTLPLRQRIRFRDTVAFYSTLLGAAAFYDGVSKHIKRKDLDDAIRNTQAEIEEISKDQERRLEALDLSNCPENIDPPQLWGSSGKERDYHAETLGRTQSLAAFPAQTKIAPRSQEESDGKFTIRRGWIKQWRRPGEATIVEEFFEVPPPGSHTGNKESLSLLSVFNTFLRPKQGRRGRPPQEAWTDTANPIPSRRIRLQREAAMARLIFCLIREYVSSDRDAQEAGQRCVHLDLPDGTHTKLSFDDLPEIKRNIDELTFRLMVLRGLKASPQAMSLIADTPSPNYRMTGDEGHETEIDRAARQNDILIDIFAHSSSLSELLSGLCTAILGQQAAPNIHTYNILAVKFQDLGLHQAVYHVIDALLNSAIAQNEVTHVAVSNYYLFYTSSNSFRGYCNVMQGGGALGIGLDYRADNADALLNPDQFFVSHKDMTYPQTGPDSPTRVLRTAAMNQEVYEATIIGLLHIRDFANAMAQYSSMLANGFSHSTRIHEAILCASVDQEDWELGYTIWGELQSAPEPVSTMNYYWALQLCARFARHKEFDEILSQGLKSGALKEHLYITSFWLNDSRKVGLRRWTFNTRKLLQHIWVPGLRQMDYAGHFNNIQHLPNLYTMLLARYIAVFESRKEHLPWLDHDAELMNRAKRELNQAMAEHDACRQSMPLPRSISAIGKDERSSAPLGRVDTTIPLRDEPSKADVENPISGAIKIRWPIDWKFVLIRRLPSNLPDAPSFSSLGVRKICVDADGRKQTAFKPLRDTEQVDSNAFTNESEADSKNPNSGAIEIRRVFDGEPKSLPVQKPTLTQYFWDRKSVVTHYISIRKRRKRLLARKFSDKKPLPFRKSIVRKSLPERKLMSRKSFLVRKLITKRLFSIRKFFVRKSLQVRRLTDQKFLSIRRIAPNLLDEALFKIRKHRVDSDDGRQTAFNTLMDPSKMDVPNLHYPEPLDNLKQVDSNALTDLAEAHIEKPAATAIPPRRVLVDFSNPPHDREQVDPSAFTNPLHDEVRADVRSKPSVPTTKLMTGYPYPKGTFHFGARDLADVDG